jgi:hypothetical protein
MKLVLERLDSGDEGTFGRLQIGQTSLFTGELPWRENISNLSCLPTGSYLATFTLSSHLRRFTYSLQGTSPRTGIRIHSANLMGDTTKGFRSQLNGCIALGEALGTLDNQKAVILSRPAISRFESYLNRKPFHLEIVG